MSNELKYSKMSPEKLNEIIWENIKKIENSDSIELYIPWHFGSAAGEHTSEPLKITFRIIKEGKTYEITDHGRAVTELERKTGDVTPYLPRIKKLLYDTGMHELRAGRIIRRLYCCNYRAFRHGMGCRKA